MRLTSFINNHKCLEWGLNIQQGALFDLLNQLHSWAEPIYLEGKVFYWASRQMICNEIPLAYSKPDTVYRALKLLAEKELIIYTKIGEKDCISLTQKGMEWNSEINPKLGNKSEETRKKIRISSEINPTYKNTNYHNTNISNKENITKEKSTPESQPQKPYSDEFEKWWEIYPRKSAKGGAYKIWKKEKLDKRIDELIKKLTQQNAMQFAFTDPQFIPYPSTYLNEARYDDEVQPVRIQNEANKPTHQLSAVERVQQNIARSREERASKRGGIGMDLVINDSDIF